MQKLKKFYTEYVAPHIVYSSVLWAAGGYATCALLASTMHWWYAFLLTVVIAFEIELVIALYYSIREKRDYDKNMEAMEKLVKEREDGQEAAEVIDAERNEFGPTER